MLSVSSSNGDVSAIPDMAWRDRALADTLAEPQPAAGEDRGANGRELFPESSAPAAAPSPAGNRWDAESQPHF